MLAITNLSIVWRLKIVSESIRVIHFREIIHTNGSLNPTLHPYFLIAWMKYLKESRQYKLMYLSVPTLEQHDYMKQVTMHWRFSRWTGAFWMYRVRFATLVDWLTDMCKFFADFLKNSCTYFNHSRKIFQNHFSFSTHSPINYDKKQIWLENVVNNFQKNTEHM